MNKRFSALRKFLNGEADTETDEQDVTDAPGEGEGEGDEEGGEDEGDDDGEADDGEAADEADAAAADATNAREATLAERRRWATVLTSNAAEGRLEAATALLVENMSAAGVIRVLGGLPKEANTQLRSVPRHNLGGNTPAGEGRDKSAAAESRKKALAATNRGRGNAKNVTSGNRRAGAKPSNQED